MGSVILKGDQTKMEILFESRRNLKRQAEMQELSISAPSLTLSNSHNVIIYASLIQTMR